MQRPDLIVLTTMMVAGVVSVLLGLLVGHAHTFGAAGTMLGLLAGCLLTLVSPGADKRS